MLTTVTDHIVFENVEPSVLFDLYTNAEKHRLFSGAPVTISANEGDSFNAYGGFCFGKNLHIEKNKLIVQSWKAQGWNEDIDPSLVSLRLVKENNDTHLYLTHADIPADKAATMLRGWEEWYWNPMRKFLSVHKN
jgi:activator of HSP90 ATPase